MSRTQSQGIEFFPFAVDFFSDKKIKILKSRYGSDGVMILIYLLCQVYREGYYTRVDDDLIFIISDELNISPDTVQQVLTFLVKRSMFNEQLFNSDTILTSDGIQERWQKAVATRAAKTPIEVGKYWLLKPSETKPFIKCTQNSNSSEKKDDSSEKKDDSSENYKQSKVKESKVYIYPPINIGARTREEPVTEFENRLHAFCKKWEISIDTNSSFLAELDFEKLDNAYAESATFLQNKEEYPFAQTLSWIIKKYQSILSHKYRDKVDKKTKPQQGVIDSWQTLHDKYAEEELNNET